MSRPEGLRHRSHSIIADTGSQEVPMNRKARPGRPGELGDDEATEEVVYDSLGTAGPADTTGLDPNVTEDEGAETKAA
jgi:hypothetical protein